MNLARWFSSSVLLVVSFILFIQPNTDTAPNIEQSPLILVTPSPVPPPNATSSSLQPIRKLGPKAMAGRNTRKRGKGRGKGPPKIVHDPVWTNRNNAKFIFFVHVHKAGGTSVVEAAAPVTRFWEPSWNGNPRTLSKPPSVIPFWTYNSSELESFIVRFKREQNVSFVAMEDTFFTYDVTTQLHEMTFSALHSANKVESPRVYVVTQFRNPFARFVSNYYYEVRTHKYVEAKGVKNRNVSVTDKLRSFHQGKGKYSGHHECVSRWNMYTRIFSSQCNNHPEGKVIGGEGDDVTEEHFRVAKARLDTLDVITILEKPGTLRLLEAQFGIKVKHSDTNRGKKNVGEKVEAELKIFEKQFEVLNLYDYMLYDYAVVRAHEMLSKLDGKKERY